MKINNYNIIGLLNTLNKFANKRLPQKICYAITKNVMIIDKEYKIYTEQLKKIIDNYDEYIEVDENGQKKFSEQGIPVMTDEIQRENFIKELNDLLSIDVELNLFTINEECFDYDNDNIYDSLTPSEIITLQNICCSQE